MKNYLVTITTKDGWQQGLEYKAKSISDALYKYSLFLNGLCTVEKINIDDILLVIIKNITDDVVIEEYKKE